MLKMAKGAQEYLSTDKHTTRSSIALSVQVSKKLANNFETNLEIKLIGFVVNTAAHVWSEPRQQFAERFN